MDAISCHIIPVLPTVVNVREKKQYKLRRIGYDNNFKQLYRFTRQNVDYLANTFLDENLETRGGALSNIEKMKSFLRYIGDPGLQVGVGEDLGIHQSTVSLTNWYVCQQIVQQADDWIQFPTTEEEMKRHQAIWQTQFMFPAAIGAIDCTHIAIKKPSIHGDEYINRKNVASFNVQATCDGYEKFTSVNCKWSGSVHDARIWRNSNIQTVLKRNIAGAILLGDEGYPLTPWLMTTYRNPQTLIERNYNKVHKSERCIIERMFGQVKQRFPILQSKLRLATERVPSIIVACFVLHNVAKYLNDPDFELPEQPISNPGNIEVSGVEEINDRNKEDEIILPTS